jgi:hypothetical protein
MVELPMQEEVIFFPTPPGGKPVELRALFLDPGRVVLQEPLDVE